jgi:hypothetical protein
MGQAAREATGEEHADALRRALIHAREALRILDEDGSSSIVAARCQWLVDEIEGKIEA